MGSELSEPAQHAEAFEAAKLSRPRTRANVVARARLFTVIDQSEDAELTLLTGPTGSGKSVLVTTWLASRPQLPVAWVTLDPADDDPMRLWTYVLKAIDKARRGSVESALAMLETPAPSARSAIDELHRALSHWSERLVIVLDNLQHVHSPTSVDLLTYAIERLPHPARIVAMTNNGGTDFGALRGRGKVSEISTGSLAFTKVEAQELFLALADTLLAETDLARVLERTEGWAAGLALAATGLAGDQSPGPFIANFSGAESPVAEYLTTEVLEPTDAATRRFMQQTSAFNIFTADLCDAVLSIQGSKARLRDLQGSNLFLLRVERPGSWYRYHPMLRELLLEELTESGPGERTALLVAGAHWLLEHGFVDDALDEISRTGDTGHAADLLAAAHLTLIRGGHADVYMTKLDALPAVEVEARPVLAAAGSLAAVMLGYPQSRRTQLARMAERAAAGLPPDESPYVLAIVSLTRALTPASDLRVAIQDARSAVDFSRKQFGELTVATLAALARNLYLAGDYAEARAVAEEAVTRPEATERRPGLINAHAVHSMAESSAGQLISGEAEARLAVDLARQSGLSESWLAGLAHHSLGYSLLLSRRHAEAERELQRAEVLLRAPEPRLDHVHALLFLVAARIARGKLTVAENEIAEAFERLSAFDNSGYLPTLAHAVRRRLDAALIGTDHEPELPSPAEFAVLRLLESDLSQRGIADQLFLSVNTVKTHTTNLYQKLGVHSRADAVTQARAAGLLPATGD